MITGPIESKAPRNFYSALGHQRGFGIRAFRIGSFHLLVSTS